MSQDLFRSTNLIYRAVESPDDDKFFHTLMSDSIAQQQTGAAIKPVSNKAVKECMNWMAEKTPLGVVICLPAKHYVAVKEKGDVIPIGQINLHSSGDAGPLSMPNTRHADIGIEIIDGYRGKGYGTEAIKWICNWAFESAGMHSIGIGCYSYNEGARRLYDTMGFVYQGKKRDAVWMNGAYHDIIEFSLLENEFKELKDKGLW